MTGRIGVRPNYFFSFNFLSLFFGTSRWLMYCPRTDVTRKCWISRIFSPHCKLLHCQTAILNLCGYFEFYHLPHKLSSQAIAPIFPEV